MEPRILGLNKPIKLLLQHDIVQPLPILIIWQAPRAGSMRRILCSDWLPERARWSDTARPKQHLINSFVSLVSGLRRFRKPAETCTKRVSNNFKLNDESTHNNKVFLICSLPSVLLTNYCLTFLRNMVKINCSYLPVAFVSFQGLVYAYVCRCTFVSINI